MVNLSTDNKMAAVKQIIASLHLLQDAKKEADEVSQVVQLLCERSFVSYTKGERKCIFV